MTILFTTELKSFNNIKTSSEILVDTSHSQEPLKINIDIIVNRLPCSILSLDVQDATGTHILNIEGEIKKYKLDKEGNLISEFKENKFNKTFNVSDYPQPDYEDVKRELINNDGCHLKGKISVLRISGNFHISSHAYGKTLNKLMKDGLFSYDISHRINHISFGDESELESFKNNQNIVNFNPIDGEYKIKKNNTDNIYEYYLKIVPTKYIDINENFFDFYQFTSNSNEVLVKLSLPTIYFRYDISPFVVKFVENKENFFIFFINICAIIGGIYSVFGILDTLLNKLVRISDEENILVEK